MLSPMNSSSQNSANPLMAKVQQLFSRDLALENDYLRQKNRILRSKLGTRRKMWANWGLEEDCGCAFSKLSFVLVLTTKKLVFLFCWLYWWSSRSKRPSIWQMIFPAVNRRLAAQAHGL